MSKANLEMSLVKFEIINEFFVVNRVIKQISWKIFKFGKL